MIIKIAGFVLVMLASTVAGLFYASKDTYRIKDLLQIKKGLNILKSEIEYSLTPLPEAMLNISSKIGEPINSIFKDFHKISLEHRKLDIYEIWVEAIYNNKDNTYFEPEDIETLKTFGKTLGYLDKDMQLNSIELTLDYIDERLGALNEVSQKNKKLYTSLGVLSGLMVCVILS